MSKPVLKILQIFISCALLLLVFYNVGLFNAEGRSEFVEVIRRADLQLLIASVLVGFLVNLSSALKWYMLAMARELRAGYWRFFSYYLVGQFYNLILPTSVGGDVVRSYELGKFTGKQADALASVFVERYTGVLVLLLLSGLAVLSQLSVFSVNFVLISLFFFTLGLGFIAWMIFDTRLYVWVRSRMLNKWPVSEVVFSKLDKLLASVKVYGNHRSALVWAFVNSLVFYLLAVLNVYVTALVFELDVRLIDMLIATPIIMLIMNIPLSVGNIGLMEFAYYQVFQLLGYSPALGLMVAILMRIKSLIDGVLGGILHPIFVTKKHE
ncbi:MAG: lysylphosphatidylglycerol synthase transmembrane domain-containing protein [Pseudomonadota bacterium]